ncbi:MAG: hypothetical protein DWP97_12815 [Calditrichaeota bacterium]|nr:MAG: hypothetical protein DWP97_12815 [Calditrichota bacterium]
MSSLSRQFIKNVITSNISFAIRIVLNFFFIPYITFMLGSEAYGVWVIIFQTITYFTLFDVGLNSAITKFVSGYLPKQDFRSINKILQTSQLIYWGIGAIVFGLVYLFIIFFFDSFKIDSAELIEDGKDALIILGAYIAVQFFAISYGTSHSAFQRHDVLKVLHASEEIVRISVMTYLIYNGYGIVALAWAILITTTIRSLAGVVWLKNLYPELKISFGSFDKESAKKLFNYSKVSFGIALGWLVMFSSDSFILGLISSSVAAGIYAPGAQLMLYLRNIINMVGVPLIPAISHLQSNNSIDRIRSIYLKGVKYISFLSFLMATGVILYAKPFTGLWLTAEFAQTADVMVVLAVGTAFFIPQIIGNSVLFGNGHHRYVFYVLICEVITKLGLSVILIPLFGVIGMALANTIPQVLFYTTLYPILIGRNLNISYFRIMFTLLKTAIPAVIIVYGIGTLLLSKLTITGWGDFFMQIGLILIPVAFYGYLIIDSDDKAELKKFIFKN